MTSKSRTSTAAATTSSFPNSNFFAEAFAERVRKTLWGYAPEEALANEDLVREKYRGIRPAPGYPACPDQGY